MNHLQAARAIVSALSEDTRAALEHVNIVLRPRPTLVDLERGATVYHRGYFYGFAPEPCVGTELPDETPASGEIVVFTEGVRDALELERVLQHEIGHVLGHSEEEIEQMGLAP